MFTGVELRLLYGSVSGVAKKANSINGWLTFYAKRSSNGKMRECVEVRHKPNGYGLISTAALKRSPE